MKTVFLLFTLILTSCGNSPFINEGKSTSTKSADENALLGKFVLSSGTRTARGDEIKAVSVRAIWNRGPEVGGNAKLTVFLLDAQGNRVGVEEEVFGYIWMPGMGHGSAPIDHYKISDGVYELDRIFFIMGGYWEFHLQLKRNDKVVSEIKWPVEL